MEQLDRIIVDTSTLLGLTHEDRASPPEKELVKTGAIEALVLFEEIILDEPSIVQHHFDLSWLVDILEGARLVNSENSEIEDLYLRGATLFQAIDWPPNMADLIDQASDSGLGGKRITREGLGGDRDTRTEMPGPKVELYSAEHDIIFGSKRLQLFYSQKDRDNSVPSVRDVTDYLAYLYSPEIARAFTPTIRALKIPNIALPDQRPKKLLALIRHLYYLALQEKIGGSLLLHSAKSFGRLDAPSYGYATRIIQAFDERVQRGYSERRLNWLGDKPRSAPLPALSRFVIMSAHQRGWSVGRTIAWLREQPEVTSFRRGMRELMQYIEADDNLAVDSVLSELERQADAWSNKLGVDSRRKSRFSLQVALPFIQPAIELPVPRPTRGPAEKMLVLIKQISSTV
jgi:hypothetical protein